MRFKLAIAFLATPLTSAISFPSFLQRSEGHALSPRAEPGNSTVIPAALNIAASQYWDGNDGPWSSFPLQVGTPPQTVRVQVGTSANAVMTISPDGCPPTFPSDCSDLRGKVFYSNHSLTWLENSIFNMGIGQELGQDVAAPAGFDTVTIGWQGSQTATVPHNVVFNSEAGTYWLGVFGLNPRPSNFTTFRDPQPSFLQQLVNNHTIPSLSWGYTAGNQYRFNKVLGSLVLGGYDANRMDPTQNISLTMNADTSNDLLVNLQAIKTDAGSPSNLLPGGSIPIFLDSSTGPLWLPESACEAFEKAFGITWDNTTSHYLVDDKLHQELVKKDANVTFTLGSSASGGKTVDVVLPYAAFDLTLSFSEVANQTAYFPLKRAANESQYTLGRTFFQEAYVIADYDRSNFTVAPVLWDSQRLTSPQIVNIRRANDTSSSDGGGSSSNTGAIAGGVVGGVVAVVAIIGAAIFFMRRRKRKQRAELGDMQDKSSNNVAGGKSPSMADSEGKPIISAPMGGELGGGEIHELTAPHKEAPKEMDGAYNADPNKYGYSEMGDGTGEFFAPSKGVPAEYRGSTPIYEMPGSDVHEIGSSQQVDLTDRKR
jgi:hypothetical protein